MRRKVSGFCWRTVPDLQGRRSVKPVEMEIQTNEAKRNLVRPAGRSNAVQETVVGKAS